MKNKLHFPAKIYQIIETEDSNIIRWEPCGKAFRIVNHARFEKEVIPKFFRRECLYTCSVIIPSLTVHASTCWYARVHRCLQKPDADMSP